ncbi:MAG: hypothetical protein A3J08_00595 [Candidatus Lloydbacteria bacterium RIFCSPLOWO2_02_FULL_51_11]|uniref:Uncharacterized protein n=1 Tax=Candidatus Lloydbacteria bacterium RIFCSPLOWO2_02_FULL_51_11 TaxID=1798667 RepID=A0A1G2DPE3_9BACT|nr:MAG: hypothetical protein A3J08_00595 [Candidatus Lloydbacteria bacterium RIFCSPLOWO2_02_FULL_51_11]
MHILKAPAPLFHDGSADFGYALGYVSFVLPYPSTIHHRWFWSKKGKRGGSGAKTKPKPQCSMLNEIQNHKSRKLFI